MANNRSVEVLESEQLAVATLPVNGTIIGGGGKTDKTALVQTEDGPQLAVKVVTVGNADKPVYVDSLPATGKEGVLYMVNSGVTRDGYAIFQMFSYHNNAWVAIGAFDVGINPTGIVYEKSFDTSTATWTVTVSQ